MAVAGKGFLVLATHPRREYQRQGGSCRYYELTRFRNDQAFSSPPRAGRFGSRDGRKSATPLPVAECVILALKTAGAGPTLASAYAMILPRKAGERSARVRSVARVRNRQLRRVARRCLWWLPPSRSLADLSHFLAHVMTYGTWEDSQVIRCQFTQEELLAALKSAPPGVFDAPSWHYWHRTLGRKTVPPLPARRIPGCRPAPPASKFTWHLAVRAATRT